MVEIEFLNKFFSELQISFSRNHGFNTFLFTHTVTYKFVTHFWSTGEILKSTPALDSKSEMESTISVSKDFTE